MNETLKFFYHHYPNRTSDGIVVLWPTQAIETYWCDYPPIWEGRVGDPNAKSNCIVNDHPTVAALHVLLEKVLRLPTSVVSAAERAKWTSFAKILPDIPLLDGPGNVKVVSPYASYPVNSARHNGETPELYSVHPYRYFSMGGKILRNRDITPAQLCMTDPSMGAPTCGNSRGNSGWNQGVMNAALLGLTDIASNNVISRAKTAPAVGYRFQGFAPHEQDYEVSVITL